MNNFVAIHREHFWQPAEVKQNNTYVTYAYVTYISQYQYENLKPGAKIHDLWPLVEVSLAHQSHI